MLRDQYMLREDKYPKDLNEAYEMLNHYIVANNIPDTTGSNRKDRSNMQDNEEVIKGAQYLQGSKRGTVAVNRWKNPRRHVL